MSFNGFLGVVMGYNLNFPYTNHKGDDNDAFGLVEDHRIANSSWLGGDSERPCYATDTTCGKEEKFEVDSFDPCSADYVNSYLNRAEVQAALRAKATNWSSYSHQKFRPSISMAFRGITYNARLLSNRCFGFSTVPKLKAYAPTMEAALHHLRKPTGASKWNYVPVYVALGMIALSTVFGLYTAKQQLMYAPGVRVRKSKREKLTEVEEPEHVAEESEKFIKKSLFRKIGHVQEFEIPVPDSIRADVLAMKPRVEAFKSEARRG
ncbi:hypothetical protein Ancab_031890 [Ancistrocladus abbreviatus]